MAFNISAQHAIGTEWFLVFLSFVFLIGRIYVRGYLQRRFGASDYLAICAWTLFLVGTSLDTHLTKLGFFAPDIIYYGADANIAKLLSLETIEETFKVLYAEVFVYYSSLWSVKLALLTLYHGMIPPHMHAMRRFLYVAGAVVIIGYAALVSLFIFSCYPVDRNWNVFEPQTLCLSWSQVYVFLIALSFHLFTDVMLFAIPFILLRYLNLPRNKLLAVSAAFALGFLCVSSTVIRTICISKLDPRPTVACVFSALEEGTAIIVVCSPALRVLAERVFNYIIRLFRRKDSGGDVRVVTERDAGSEKANGGLNVKGMLAVETIGSGSKGWRSRMGSGQVGIEGADIRGGRLGGAGGIVMTFDVDVEEARVEYHNHRKQSC